MNIAVSARRLAAVVQSRLGSKVHTLTARHDSGGSDLPIHVSLSRTVFLRYHHIEPITQLLSKALAGIHRYEPFSHFSNPHTHTPFLARPSPPSLALRVQCAVYITGTATV
jgi:hypothetical protein